MVSYLSTLTWCGVLTEGRGGEGGGSLGHGQFGGSWGRFGCSVWKLEHIGIFGDLIKQIFVVIERWGIVHEGRGPQLRVQVPIQWRTFTHSSTGHRNTTNQFLTQREKISHGRSNSLVKLHWPETQDPPYLLIFAQYTQIKLPSLNFLSVIVANKREGVFFFFRMAV